jgi:dinuclear metal center YbgI/SA1388 family protein
MKVQEICNYLEQIAPLTYQESYDNSGLLLGDPVTSIRNILLCLDITPAVVDEAVSKDCNLIISHHPVIFKGVKKIISGDRDAEIILKAIKNDISVYAIHTNLDNTLNGINGLLMSKLGIPSYQVLAPKKKLLSKLATFCPLGYAEKIREALFYVGAGNIGNYDQCSFNVSGQGTFRASDKANPFVGETNKLHLEEEIKIEVIFPDHLQNDVISALKKSHPYEEVAYDIYSLKNDFDQIGAGAIGLLPEPMNEYDFLILVREVFKVQYIRHTAFRNKYIKKIALCSGTGSFLINEAKHAGADIYLCGDLKYHDFFLASDKLILADIGHYESEQWVKEWLYAVLIEKFPNFAILISDINTNPVNYF